MRSSTIDACWVQKGLSLDLPKNCTVNACATDCLMANPIYLTVEVKSSTSKVAPLVQLARWATWSRLNEVRNGVNGNHFVLPAIAVDEHSWTLYLHSYNPDSRKLVGVPNPLTTGKMPVIDVNRASTVPTTSAEATNLTRRCDSYSACRCLRTGR